MPSPSIPLRRLATLLPLLLLALGLCLPGPAAAEVRAWFDRDRIALGETVTLNIEADAGGRPDYAALAQDFRVEQQGSRRSWTQEGGRTVARTLHAVALKPLREGVITIPPLPVGSGRSPPLALTVTPAPAATASGPVFIEAEVDDPGPYVQQSVGLLLRLYYSAQLVSGQLEQPAPEGAALRRVGSDLQYSREIDGRRYQVVERRYVLVPERSGRMEIPAARFDGRGVSGWFDGMFGDRRRTLSARGPALAIEVQPVPDAAPRPWLLLHDLRLRWLQAPTQARAGDAVTVELELVADGATAAQLEAPTVAADQGAQVFPEPAAHEESLEQGRPRVRMVRSFAVLPARAGPLRIEGPRLQWWDVTAGRAREAVLPPIELEVAPAAEGGGGAAAGTAGGGRPARGGEGAASGIWPWATFAFALLWLGTLALALHWRRGVRADGSGDAGQLPGIAAVQARLAGARARLQALRRALDAGDLGEVSEALCALASPAATDLDALSRMLAPGAQREAIATLQRARWGGDDGAAGQARAAVREAFAGGPAWLEPEAGDPGPLPPLYPR